MALVAAIVVLASGVAIVAIGRDDGDVETATSTSTTTSTSSTTTTTAPTTTSTTQATTTTTAKPQVAWPSLPTDGKARAVRTSKGFVLAVTGPAGNGRYHVMSPCGYDAVVSGQPITGATVVLDAGHGGEEPGAVGPTGLREKDLNLAVVKKIKAKLEALGATVVLTRTADYRIALRSRGAIATSLQPLVYVSIHHNAEPDELRDTTGAEDYYQIRSKSSKRLAGLIVEEERKRYAQFKVRWGADRDAGAKYRLSSSGGDYYGILSRAEGVTTVLSEAGYITNPPEEQLLRTEKFRDVEATAITQAIVRYATTDDPGSGFVTPYPRTEPAGNGGGQQGCVDPKLD